MYLFKTALYIMICILCLSIIACEPDDPEDECQKTEAPHISVTVHLNISTYYQVYDQPRHPLNNAYLKVEIWKMECEDNVEGYFEYPNSHTGLEGNSVSYYVNYGMSNTEDVIVINIESEVLNMPEDTTIVQLFDRQKMETITYTQADEAGEYLNYNIDIVFDALSSED